MDRRRFIETLGALGTLAVLGPNGKPARAAATPSHPVPLYVNALAAGGWDVSLFCDPKSDGQRLFPANTFSPAQYVPVGNFVLAPTSVGAIQFFQRYTQQILLINGIFAETLDHTTGQQLAMSGSAQQGYPCFNGLLTGAIQPGAALSFVSGGSYDETANLTAKTLANPSVISAMSSTTSANAAYTNDDVTVITNAVAARLGRKHAAAQGARRTHMDLLAQARQGWEAFPAILQTLADLRANVPITDGGVVGQPGAVTDDTHQMLLAIQLGLAGYVNNATVSINLNYLSFDQHTDLASHHLVLDSYFIGLDYLMRAAAHLNIVDRVFVMGCSDFTRSPHIINPGDSPGKDHWFGSTSALFLGPGVTGNRVIGQSTDGYGNADDTQSLQAMPLHPTTLKPSETGSTLTRAHLHAELRRIAGIANHPLALAYPLSLAGPQLTLLQ